MANVEAILVPPLEAGPEDVLAAQAIILGTTENLGYMSGALKDFLDRSTLSLPGALPALALYVRAGQDGTGTRRAVESICTGLRWRAVRPPLMCRGVFSEEFIPQCEELGLAMAARLEAGIF